MLNNLKFIFPVIATYIINYYETSSRLFLVGRGEILSNEGKIQGEPKVIRAYAFGILPLIKFLLEFIYVNKMNAKEVAFADNFSIAGSLNSTKNYWDKLTASKMRLFP